ncbi:S-adenosylmethionine decarboxylase, partial [Strigomonas culicis]
MTSWASPRDAYPSSVHALMSLWGDFSTAPGSDSGLEKRFEVDFAQPITAATFTVAEMEEVFAAADQYLVSQKCEYQVTALTFAQVLVALGSQQMVASADSIVQLHKVIAPFMALCARKGVQAEWASFFRKNTHSPWEHSDTSDMMACEYAELKSSLPQGHSFLTGPIDGDHFFHYIYDNIERGDERARVEVDTQLNLFLHGLKADQVTTPTVKGVNHQLVVLPEGFYEMHRKFPEAGSATFE